MNGPLRQIVLLGVGHANAHVLRMWRRRPIPGARLVCVSSFPVAAYSGMLPATLAGQYPPGRLEIDLRGLARAAGAELVAAPACAVDLEARRVRFEGREPVGFDVLSVGVGSVPGAPGREASGGALIPVKPMQTFVSRLRERLHGLRPRDGGPVRVLVVGGGAGGIELGLCLPRYVRRTAGPLRLSLVEAGERIGAGLSPGALRKVERLLRARGVDVLTGRRVTRVTEGEAVCADGRRIPADLVVLATAAAPPPVLESVDLPKDPRGFLLIRDTLQSTGAAHVFAVGDSGTLADGGAPKAGVHAVRQGPVLWRNLHSFARGEPLARYAPQPDFLRLLNTGDGKALLDYRGWAVHARWCWRWKHRLDSRFVARFRVAGG